MVKHKKTQLVQGLGEGKKLTQVDRCGEADILNENSLDMYFSPFSPKGWSLQTPQLQKLEKRPLFQLVFLGNDEDQSVEVKETEEIDFEELKARLEEGKSVFITTKESEKIKPDQLRR